MPTCAALATESVLLGAIASLRKSLKLQYDGTTGTSTFDTAPYPLLEVSGCIFSIFKNILELLNILNTIFVN